ncbi:MAG: hypothetical protein ACK4KW_09190 [Gemmobacter sp.]
MGLVEGLAILYVLVAVWAKAMSQGELSRSGSRSFASGSANALACALWPLTLVLMVLQLRLAAGARS